MSNLKDVVIGREHFSVLFSVLADKGYTLIGPTIRDRAIIYDEITDPSDLPIGWTDEQKAGHYRLKHREDQALFGYVLGPQSWKKFLHLPAVKLWQAKQSEGHFEITQDTPTPPALALIGVRPCELHAMSIQDQVFTGGAYVDPHYKVRRDRLFIVAVNCTAPGGTCFCGSMQTGPQATQGFDLALTEILEGEQHYFVAEAGSKKGNEILQKIPHQPITAEEKQLTERRLGEACHSMGRAIQTADLKELLYRNVEHPHWEEVAQRCMACANCTMVCPTCFCTTIEDVTSLDGETAERWRKWDSCFTMEFSYIHGGSVRYTPKARYRQWITHKLATWVDQFGAFGCVGCGRCITWCPVGIDITAEVQAIRESEGRSEASPVPEPV